MNTGRSTGGASAPSDRMDEQRAIEDDYARVIAYRRARSPQEIRATRAWLREAGGAPLPKGRPGRPLGGP